MGKQFMTRRQGARLWECECGGGRDRGTDTEAARKHGLVPQEEINKCTHIQKKRYPSAKYNKSSPAKRAKHWQL
jgi:hypothetical protein